MTVVDLSLIGSKAVWGGNWGSLQRVWGLWFHMTKRKKALLRTFQQLPLKGVIWQCSFELLTERKGRAKERETGKHIEERQEDGSPSLTGSAKPLSLNPRHISVMAGVCIKQSGRFIRGNNTAHTGNEDGCRWSRAFIWISDVLLAGFLLQSSWNTKYECVITGRPSPRRLTGII